MSASAGAHVHLPPDCDVAVVGAGPIGLMLANLLGTAGVNVVVLEKNDGLVGLPRAIAYDPETLRLFAQVGLFDRIVDGLVQDPQVVYLNARGVKLMEITPPRSAFTVIPSLALFTSRTSKRYCSTGLHDSNECALCLTTASHQSRKTGITSTCTSRRGGGRSLRSSLSAAMAETAARGEVVALFVRPTPSAGSSSTAGSRTITVSTTSRSFATRAGRPCDCRRSDRASVGSSCSWPGRSPTSS